MLKQKFSLSFVFFILIFCTGLFFRLKLYFLNPGLHCDEANLALNIISKSYTELFKPLDRLQVAPPFFLIISKLFYSLVNFRFTARFSDLILRLFPLLSGIAAIPAFGYLLARLFKNKFVTLLGMLLLALAPSVVLYSCIFKQYSTELLITIITLIIFSKIELKERSCKYFILLGLVPFFSLSSFFILAGGFGYLFIKSCREKSFKNLFYGVSAFSAVFIIYLAIFLIPVYSRYFQDMTHYWNASFYKASGFFSYIKILFSYLLRPEHGLNIYTLVVCISSLFMLKNIKSFCYTVIPLILTCIGVKTGHYPLDERLMIFMAPVLIMILLYPLTVIPQKFYNQRIQAVYLILFLFLTYGCIKFPSPIQYIVTKPEAARNIWEYLDEHYDGKTPVIPGYSLNSNVYYKMFYKNLNYSRFMLINNTGETLGNLPAGDYYIVLTGYEFYRNLLGKTLDEFLKEAPKIEILEMKEFIPPHIEGFTEMNTGRLLKIRKT